MQRAAILALELHRVEESRVVNGVGIRLCRPLGERGPTRREGAPDAHPPGVLQRGKRGSGGTALEGTGVRAVLSTMASSV